ncbi:MAG TPA: leucyl aminopeptidase [Chloroflexota bacterium]
MASIEEMMPSARKLAGQCTSIMPGESVLIVADSGMVGIANAVAAAARERGGEPVIAIIDQRSADSTEPPVPVAAAMREADVIFSAVSISITHTRAVKEAVAAGRRAIALTAVTEEMMLRGGLEADFDEVKVRCRAVGEKMARARQAHITSDLGTDLTFRVEGRRVNVMPCVVGPGEFSPAPTAEVNFSPIEGTANGLIVADASIPYLGIGLLRKPVRFTVRDGYIVGIEAGDPEQVATLKAAWEKQADPNVYNVAEMGVGMNPKCRFTGLMLEDEGVLGSVHIGTGTNITLGGNVKAKSHYDLIMSKPTVDLDGVRLIERGELKL